MNVWEGVKESGLKCKKTNIIKSSACLLQKSSFLLKKTEDKDFTKTNKDFIMILIHQIDNRPKYSFTSSQLCLGSVKWIFFIDQVFEIESRQFDPWLLGRWSVGRWSVDLIKPGSNNIVYFPFWHPFEKEKASFRK